MKYLGVDFGLKRIGLAISEGEIASPWQILVVRNFTEALEKVSKVIKEGQFNKVIVGLPEGKMAKNVNGFIKALKKQGFEVETADETLSSKKALGVMIEQGIKQKRRKFQDDYSAAEILQNYLEDK